MASTSSSDHTASSTSTQDALVLRMDTAARKLLTAGTTEVDTQAELQTMCLPITALWCRILRFDPAVPDWPDRDRCVVPSSAMLPLLAAMLRLTAPDAHGLSPTTLEYGQHPAVEIATGPAGQGMAAAAGMALAEQQLANRYGRSLVNHRTWVLARDSDLATGVALEAAQLASRFGLNRMAVLVCPSPLTDPTDFSDSLARFSASGWSVRKVRAHDLGAIMAALQAILRARKPTLLACMPECCSPLPDMPPEEELTGPWSPTARRGSSIRRSWLRRLAQHRARADFEREQLGKARQTMREDWGRVWRQTMRTAPNGSTQQAAFAGLRSLSILRQDVTILAATSSTRSSRRANLPAPFGHAAQPCGIQEHGMAGMLNGMARHGGVLPCGVAGMMTIDRMRSALRMTALMRSKVLYLLTDDGLALSDNGGGWQPVEQLASLRAMPHLAVFRPACAEETFACWQAALNWPEGPALLILCPHPPPPRASRRAGHYGGPSHGGYLISCGTGPRHVTLMASGPEVAIATQAGQHLSQQGLNVAVVSIPCWEVFAQQPATYRSAVLGREGLRVGIEAASSFGWERWLGAEGIFIGMDDFGISAPANAVYERFGITAGAICEKVLTRLLAAGAQKDPSLTAPTPSRLEDLDMSLTITRL
ncbi:transketolase-like TK C-terminal-containing protein [Acetobacter ghanensis]|uniref:Transketolase n=1 Tax=Acetobacter ghanensis TaxID=431306 RepID=A0A0U5FV09_9PROT|nr:transketolase C-terminal domain-containing protein [Acetobacter ghanensis]NHO40018.1 transketolase [Acetobacter ghanensis]CEF54000.1 transketolase [Acetobacter ghanensis]